MYASREFDTCNYIYFLYKEFTFEPYICNDCHDSMQNVMNFNDFAIVSVGRSAKTML